MKVNYIEKLEIKKESLLVDILQDIQSGKYQHEITEIRSLLNKEVADSKKRKLPAFTPCGVFDDRRRAENLLFYNRMVVLDYDNIPNDTYDHAFEKVISEPTTYCAFVSPSGNGLKVLVKVSSDKDKHKDAFSLVVEYYEALTSLSIDKSGKDLSRMCFVSYDKDLYLNEKAEVFKIEIPVAVDVDTTLTRSVKYKSTSTLINRNENQIFDMIKSFTENKEEFVEGNRNNFIYQLACNANRAGMPIRSTLNFTLNEYGYNNEEVSTTVGSAYNNNTSEFGIDSDRYKEKDYTYPQIAQVADVVTLQQKRTYKSGIENTPFIPNDVYDKLPDLLKLGCSKFTDPRQRDLYLTGGLGVLSGCIRSVSGRYHREVLNPNLYVFITAPAASGKGALTHTRNFGVKYHEELTSLSKENKAKSILFIPGNSSASAIMAHLNENSGEGVFFETEADTLSNTFKQEWGSFSDLLRKAFHHEPVTLSRKVDNEYIEMRAPKLSIVLSGTPGQIQGLIKSSEDGLFSRFLFYAFKGSDAWEDVKPSESNNIQDFTEELIDSSYDFISKINGFDSISFTMKDEHWGVLNQISKANLKQGVDEYGEGAISLVKRMGNMWFRIAMILTVIRSYENNNISQSLVCSDIDFEISKQLITTFKEHILYVYSILPNKEIGKSTKEKELYESLPNGEFGRKDLINLAKELNIGTRSADDILKYFKNQNLINTLKHGVFVKA